MDSWSLQPPLPMVSYSMQLGVKSAVKDAEGPHQVKPRRSLGGPAMISSEDIKVLLGPSMIAASFVTDNAAKSIE